MFAPAFHTPFDFIKYKTYQRQDAATVALRPHLEKFEIQAAARADGSARSVYPRTDELPYFYQIYQIPPWVIEADSARAVSMLESPHIPRAALVAPSRGKRGSGQASRPVVDIERWAAASSQSG